MNARDLLTALNDIDPKLLEDTLPWGAPVQKSRRPVWAVAAAIVLCVGLVGGVVLSQNYVSQLANDATGPTQGLTELQYAQGNTEELDQANLRTDLTGPVSYTHLDVYKRQVLDRLAPADLGALSPQHHCVTAQLVDAHLKGHPGAGGRFLKNHPQACLLYTSRCV